MITLKDIAPEFMFVQKLGLTTGEVDYDPRKFGDAILVMNGNSFSLRFKRDRSQVFVDIGNDISKWNKLEYAIEFIDKQTTQKQLGEPPSLAEMARLLQANWTKAENLFNDTIEAMKLHKFSQEKANSLVKDIFHRSQRRPGSG